MPDLVLSPAQERKPVVSRRIRVRPYTNVASRNGRINWIIRYTFYVFVFSLPFEAAYLAGGATLAKLFGLALAGFALLQPRLCYRFPPNAFLWFALYMLVFAAWSVYLLLVPPNVPDFSRAVIQQFVTLVQLLALFWISYNLLKQEPVIGGVLWALAASTFLLATLQVLGVTSEVSGDPSRLTAFEGNPNNLATVLALGLLAVFGLGYGRRKDDWKGRMLFWLGFGIIAIAIVQTGSRGTLVALIAGLSIVFLRGKSLATKLKFGTIALTGILVLVVASYQIEGVRERWEKTFYDEDLAGRHKIYAQTAAMILERPLTGWGPVNHLWELGPRVGKSYRDEHNVYFWILAEVGLLGAVPFFIGLWLCSRAAWLARHGLQGILPLVMLLFLLTASMNGTLYKNKYFWVVLSLALAAGSYSTPGPRVRMAGSTAYARLPGAARRDRLVEMRLRKPSREL